MSGSYTRGWKRRDNCTTCFDFIVMNCELLIKKTKHSNQIQFLPFAFITKWSILKNLKKW